MSPQLLSQKMAAKEEEKKMSSTAAKAISLVAKGTSQSWIHQKHQSAFALMAGIVDVAEKRNCCFLISWTRVDRQSA